MYGVEISAGKISQITDKILPTIQEWRTRPLQSFYPIIYLDAVHFKVRHEGRYEPDHRKLVKSKAAWASETALIKQIFLSLTHNEKSWKRKARGWKSIQRERLDMYADRIQPHIEDT